MAEPRLAYGMLGAAADNPWDRAALRITEAPPEDPFERAALRTQRSVRPPGGRPYTEEADAIARNLVAMGIVPGMGGPALLRALPLAAEMILDPTEAQAGPAKVGTSVAKQIAEALRKHGLSSRDVTVLNPKRIEAPGIYQNPKAIVEQARAAVSPESGAMKQLFGVDRQDLYDIARSRSGNITPQDIQGMPWWEGRKVPDPVAQVMTDRNAQRYIDVLAEAQKYPELARTQGWYVMDPAYARLEELLGPYKAPAQYNYLNTMHGPFSASSAVDTELHRGSTGAMMAARGRQDWNRFKRYGNVAEDERTRNFPPEMRGMPAHMAHSTAHTPALDEWLKSGNLQFGTAKVPSYIAASGVPQTGFQTSYPIIDAHMGTNMGYYDVRTAPGVSMAVRETHPLAQYFAQNIARPMGLEPVSGQAMGWSVFGPQTGVKSMIGAPKLEIASDLIMRRAAREGKNPEAVRDAWLKSMGAIGGFGGLAGPLLERAGMSTPREEM